MATRTHDRLVSDALERIQNDAEMSSNEYKQAFLAAVNLLMDSSNEHVKTIGTATSLMIATGLCDSDGVMLSFGDLVQKPTECNEDMHGSWAVYEVVRQGSTPLLSYRYSERGEVLPSGYLVAPLSDEYDRKMFCFAKQSKTLRPLTKLRRLEQ